MSAILQACIISSTPWKGDKFALWLSQQQS
jgi:hypothetical protein